MGVRSLQNAGYNGMIILVKFIAPQCSKRLKQ